MSKPVLLIAVPVRGSLHPALKARACELASAVMDDARNQALFEMRLGWQEDDGPPEPQPGRWGRIAWARNALLAAHMGADVDYVLMVDADIVDYPPDLPAQLYEANPDGVTAPLVLIEHSSQFYDTLGFVEDGRRARFLPPYFHGEGELVELDSVGCIYLIPARVLREAAYHSAPVDRERDHQTIWATGHTDHWPVMQQARAMGLRACCLRAAVARHARLTDYGEGWH